MAEYKSAYTGPQIDAAIGAVAGKQDTLVSGTNIKTINNESLLGSGNIDIQGGGGGVSMRVVDATNPDDWSGEGPTQACLVDILTHEYQVIYIINIPSEEPGLEYGIAMYLNAKGDNDTVGEEVHMRQYLRFDSDDEESGYIQGFTFVKEGDDDAEMTVDEYPLGGGGSSSANIYFGTCEIGGTYNDEVTLDLSSITTAIDSGSEVIIRVNGSYGYDTRYFRIATTSLNGKTTIDGNDYWTPVFKCKTNEAEYTMVYDRYASESFVYKIYDSYPKFTPTSVDLANNAITFDLADYSYIYNEQPKNITLNLGDSGTDLWIDFKLAISNNEVGEESYTYVSSIIPDHSSGSEMTIFTLWIYNDGGNVTTKIYLDQLTTSVPV